MSVHLIAPGTIHDCSMCPVQVYAAWGELAKKGWWSKYVGAREPLKLCPDCRAIIDNRREAARQAALPAA